MNAGVIPVIGMFRPGAFHHLKYWLPCRFETFLSGDTNRASSFRNGRTITGQPLSQRLHPACLNIFEGICQSFGTCQNWPPQNVMGSKCNSHHLDQCAIDYKHSLPTDLVAEYLLLTGAASASLPLIVCDAQQVNFEESQPLQFLLEHLVLQSLQLWQPLYHPSNSPWSLSTG